MPRKKADAAAAPALVGAAEKIAEKVEKVAKKASPKKAAEKPARVDEVHLQACGGEWNVSDCKERAVAAYVAEGHRASGVKKLVIYLKPEEGKAYYVINDNANGSIDL